MLRCARATNAIVSHSCLVERGPFRARSKDGVPPRLPRKPEGAPQRARSVDGQGNLGRHCDPRPVGVMTFGAKPMGPPPIRPRPPSRGEVAFAIGSRAIITPTGTAGEVQLLDEDGMPVDRRLHGDLQVVITAWRPRRSAPPRYRVCSAAQGPAPKKAPAAASRKASTSAARAKPASKTAGKPKKTRGASKRTR